MKFRSELLKSHNLYVVLGALALVYIAKILRCAYATPLRTVPGPWHSKFTSFWLKKQILSGRRMHWIHEQHQKYGPVVRVGPNEVDFTDQSAFKEIHRIGSGYNKDPWYTSFRTGETQDVFSMTNPREHAQRRKLFSPLFSNSNLAANWYHTIIDKVNTTVNKIKEEAYQNGEVDIFKWWTFMTADVISHLAFGEPFGMLEQGKKTYHMQKIDEASKFGLLCSELPWIRYIVNWTPIRAVQELDADSIIQHLAEQVMQKTRGNGLGATHVFSRIVAVNEKDKNALTDYELAFEAGGFIVAGSGTTAVSLTYLVWAVLSDPEVQAKLEAEVGALQDGYTDTELENLSYLSAVIEETLRMYSAAPGALPRVVPNGGATLGGYFIPEGTTASTQAYSYHRDATVYPNPER
ncbi:hypothetical protein SEUCBS139899_001147 [Sporothrix eucalyptigena]|uniref:Cytochrome P450 monooxygenase n=1 Tax=Sporothrix eucalyptigena TaxID=1812306 RepID=A0ABP0B5Z4_9PEZI